MRRGGPDRLHQPTPVPTRQLQEPRRVDGAGAEDDLAPAVDDAGRRLPERRQLVGAAAVEHADRRRALEEYPAVGKSDPVMRGTGVSVAEASSPAQVRRAPYRVTWTWVAIVRLGRLRACSRKVCAVEHRTPSLTVA